MISSTISQALFDVVCEICLVLNGVFIRPFGKSCAPAVRPQGAERAAVAPPRLEEKTRASFLHDVSRHPCPAKGQLEQNDSTLEFALA